MKGSDTDAAHPNKRWYDREPLKLWIPVSAVAAGVLQTTAYLGYKFFYLPFGVRPEEVGYDYVSLFPRTALQLVLFLTLALLALALVSVLVALFAATNETPSSIDSGAIRLFRSGRWQLAVGASRFGLMCVCLLGLIFEDQVGIFGLLIPAAFVALVVLEQRRLPLSHLRVRVYRDGRRIALLAALTGFLVVGADDGSLDWREAFGIMLLVFAADLWIPTRPVQDEQVEGGGTSLWLFGTLVLCLVAVAGFAASYEYFIHIEDRADARVSQVVRGGELTYDPGDIWVIGEPRADRVFVRWVAPRPPAPFGRCRQEPCAEVLLTYLGQNAGTSVFLDLNAPKVEVYRMPTGAVVLRRAGPSTA